MKGGTLYVSYMVEFHAVQAAESLQQAKCNWIFKHKPSKAVVLLSSSWMMVMVISEIVYMFLWLKLR